MSELRWRSRAWASEAVEARIIEVLSPSGWSFRSWVRWWRRFRGSDTREKSKGKGKDAEGRLAFFNDRYLRQRS